MNTIAPILNLLFIIISALLAIAFYTLRERKFLGYIQLRKGPNKPNITALTIPIADAGKLFSKEKKNSILINLNYHSLTPITIIILALLLWPIFPIPATSFFIKFNILYFLCITRIRIYTIFIAGWSSNSRWGLLGALRRIAQTISYEVRISLILICFILHPSTINTLTIIQDFYSWTALLLTPLALSWIISILAETHRTPFDFAEGESELVSGFNIEYKSSIFAIIFIAEYINILLISILTIVIITKSYYRLELTIKRIILSLIFIWTRGALPRLRYDILIDNLWKKLLPISLTWIFTTISLTSIIK